MTALRQRFHVGTPGHCLLLAIALSGLLAGCSSTPREGVQVVDRNGNPVQKRVPITSGQHVVQRGETLYSIAFRYGWDWKALASRNRIAPPYVIRPGQRIRFDGGTAQDGAPVTAGAPVSTPVVISSSPSGSSTRTTTVVPLPPKSSPGQNPAPVVTPPTPTAVPATPGVRSSSGWAWPSSGLLIGRFSSNGSLNKGIDIAGELGQPVLAASDGTVVYAGSGLRGYGELIIIKHSDTYVSAYGHNRRLLVREGQQVKAGQNIAEMGSTGTDRVKLHFEIRRQGKPVDPLQYLPRR
ncbi:peptidoglycan DD-metalloendopeptidase family protein [Pseudomonas sp. RIT-PI-AD]|uniref:peptidoglycan DD-metalloendopeptidase family protein n=1 Tax=Pseudomonas sp. RIT-PI-AD TaxID=3035294 RepID=UPI0021D7D421|nr:peptidoglycan DD-metalloendopeptidase family protein [Pseudomonas sp. RIT-PI-AD]